MTIANFWKKYYEQLRGAVIVDVGIIEDEDYGLKTFWPAFIVMLASGERIQIEIAQDEEGNGPGFIAGLPTPKPYVSEAN